MDTLCGRIVSREEACGNHVGIMWRPRGDHVRTTWEPRGNNVGTTWESRWGNVGHVGTACEPCGEHVAESHVCSVSNARGQCGAMSEPHGNRV